MLTHVQGSARVIRCLQDNREELGMECSATLFDQEVSPEQVLLADSSCCCFHTATRPHESDSYSRNAGDP